MKSKAMFIMLVSVLFFCACGSDVITQNRTEEAANRVGHIEKWNDVYADLLMKKQHDSTEDLGFL